MNRKLIVDALQSNNSAALSDALGYDAVDLDIPREHYERWGIKRAVVESARVVGMRGNDRFVVIDTGAQTIADAVRRTSLPSATNVFWVAFGDVVEFANLDRKRHHLRSLRVDRNRPEPESVDRLGLIADGIPDRNTIAKALDQDEMTHRFFAAFQHARKLLAASWIDGPSDDAECEDLALQTLLRIVFVYFLQKRGTLPTHYLSQRLIESRGAFYRRCLRPLFFNVLNKSRNRRAKSTESFEQFPYLNGGLFDPTRTETRYPELDCPDVVWTGIFENLFERFHFVLRESSNQTVAAVDPEMLGKVFEGLMQKDTRLATGAFYTPKPIVVDVVQTSLLARINDEVDGDFEHFEAFGDTDRLDREMIGNLISQMKILDPAVGTGAFLVESLNQLLEIRASLGLSYDHAAARTIITDQLFGIDINPTAVRLAALRLWLALLVRTPVKKELEPLPNLSHHIVFGDALLDEVSFIDRRSRQKLAKLQIAFVDAHGVRKQQLAKKIALIRKTAVVSANEKRLDGLREERRTLDNIATHPDLFGSPTGLSEKQRAHRRQNENEHKRLRQHVDDLRHGRIEPTFGFATHFPTASEHGFDLIVTNPPWLKLRKLERSYQNNLQSFYLSSTNRSWVGAERIGIQTPYGTQADLCSIFVERGFQLLNPAGVMGAVVPAKLFRGIHGATTRQQIGSRRLHTIRDLSENSSLFGGATTYPGIVVVGNRPQPQASFEVSDTDVSRITTTSELPIWNGDLAQPWFLTTDEKLRSIFRTVMKECVPLGSISELRPRRGLFTGSNKVFVGEPGEFSKRFSAQSQRFIRDVVRGRTFHHAEHSELIFAYDKHFRVEKNLPADLRNYFEDHRDELERRGDHRANRPIWELFRVHESMAATKVAWRDLDPVFSPKIVPSSMLPLNTIYYVPAKNQTDAKRILSLLSHPVTVAFLRIVCERARGGWRRHFAWNVNCVPIPRGEHPDANAFPITAKETAYLRRFVDATNP